MFTGFLDETRVYKKRLSHETSECVEDEECFQVAVKRRCQAFVEESFESPSTSDTDDVESLQDWVQESLECEEETWQDLDEVSSLCGWAFEFDSGDEQDDVEQDYISKESVSSTCDLSVPSLSNIKSGNGRKQALSLRIFHADADLHSSLGIKHRTNAALRILDVENILPTAGICS